MEVNKSPTLSRYKNTMRELLMMYYPTASPNDIGKAIDYSIAKSVPKKKASLHMT
jgi:hypothetical protein